MNILAIPLNFIACNGLNEAHQKDIKKEDVLGINVQNILGYIPIYNFFIGTGRIEKSVEHLKKFENSALSGPDKLEVRNTRFHLARGFVELVPGVALIFLIPDICFALVKCAIKFFQNKKSPAADLDEAEKILNGLDRNHSRWKAEIDSEEKRSEYKEATKQLMIDFIEKINETETKIEEMKEGLLKTNQKQKLEILKARAKLNGKNIPNDTDGVENFLNDLG